MKKEYFLTKIYFAIAVVALSIVFGIKLYKAYDDNNKENDIENTTTQSEVRKQGLYNKTVMTAFGEYTITESDYHCLVINNYHEARGDGFESIIGTTMIAVNRAASGYRNKTSICDVVLEKKQFSWTNNKRLVSYWYKYTNPKSVSFIEKAIEAYVNGYTIAALYKSRHYHKYDVSPSWADQTKMVAVVGSHLYYTGVA